MAVSPGPWTIREVGQSGVWEVVDANRELVADRLTRDNAVAFLLLFQMLTTWLGLSEEIERLK